MTQQTDGLPVLVIDGARFSDLDGFSREFSRLLDNHTWRGNLDAFYDLLRGGFGTPENGWVLRWLNSDSSRFALGHEATIQRLERLLLTCHPSNRSSIEGRIRRARRSEGPTLFDEIVEIIRDHGAGGNESEDGIVLELV
jgi:RNAse (barnase) inhibitor barstar